MRERWLTHFLAVPMAVFAISACSVERRDFGVNGNGATSTGGSHSQVGGTSAGGTGRLGSGTSTGGIAGQSTSSVNDAGNVDSIKPNIQVNTDLVGFATKLDASGSAGQSGEALTYQWSFTSVPAGSKVTTSSLSSASTANPTFQPDLGGDYRVRLTVTSGGLSNYVETTFTVPTFDVAYLNVAGDNSSYTRAGAMVKSDGQSARNVGCYFSNSAKTESDWIENFKSEGQFSFRAYYPLDTRLSTLLAYTYTDDSTGTMHTQIAGPGTDCSGASPLATVGGNLPVFSPNGMRIAMVLPNSADANVGSSVYTVGVDGKEPHIIRTDATGTLGMPSIYWVDDTHVAWIETQSRTTPGFASWAVIYVSADADHAFDNNLLTNKVLDCDGATNPINAVGRVSISKSVMYVSEPYTAHPDAGTISGVILLRLWRLEPVNGAYLCDSTAIQNKILVPDGTSNFVATSDSVPGGANDFELSPDGTKIILYARVTASEAELQPTRILIGPSDGSAPFTTLVEANGCSNIGQHWVAGGRQITWTKILQEGVTVDASTYSRPKTSSVWIINSDGTNARQLVAVSSTASQARTVHTGGFGGYSCTLCRPASRSRWPFLSCAVTLGLLFVRKNRRRSKQSDGTSASTLSVQGES